MERALNAQAERERIRKGGAEGGLGSLWKKIADRRNSLAHAGFRPEVVKEASETVIDLIGQCERGLESGSLWRTVVPGPLGRVLVSPLGLSPGVLFTAIKRLLPNRGLVITSRESDAFVAEVCSRAGWGVEGVSRYIVEDAHACFGEVDRVTEWAREALLDAGEVLVNVTGGTTALQYLVERIAGEAVRLGVPTERCALLDRRSPDEQRREPYVPGEVVRLRGDETPTEG
jgi:hypothetical protein